MGSVLHCLRAMVIGLVTLVLGIAAARAGGGIPESVRDWEDLWTSVLARNVDESGRIDFASLVRSHTELDRVVAFIAANDPVSRPDGFPSREAQLAFHINAYNALAMHGVVEAGVPASLGGLRKFTFFWLRSFAIGSSSTSLYSYENDVIRPFGDPRIHFALNCMVVGCPRLPRAAFTAERLDEQLDAVARTFVNEGRNLRIDENQREVWLSAIFKFYTEDFVAHEPSLIAYVNLYRTDKIPADFKVRFLEYDWTVNVAKPLGNDGR